MNYLTVAVECHSELLANIFGGKKTVEQLTTKVSKDAQGKALVLTPSIFDIQFDKPLDKPTPRRRRPPARRLT